MRKARLLMAAGLTVLAAGCAQGYPNTGYGYSPSGYGPSGYGSNYGYAPAPQSNGIAQLFSGLFNQSSQPGYYAPSGYYGPQGYPPQGYPPPGYYPPPQSRGWF